MKMKKLILLLVLALVLLIGVQAALAEEDAQPKGIPEIYALGDGVSDKGEDYAYDAGYHVHDLSGDAFAEAGAFVVQRPDGNTVGGYGVTVGLDARYAAGEVYADGTVGYEDFNLHGSGTIAAGEVKAKADFTAGIVNGQPTMVVEGGAELNAFSVGGSAGVSIDGVDVNVYGGLKVGLGAKARMGYQDGKFSANLDVTAGLGFEVGFEVDVAAIEEKMEEAAMDMAEETVKNMAETVKTIETVKAVSEVTQNVVTEVFKTGWKCITSWF